MRVIVAWLLVALCAAWAAVRLLGLERGFPLVPLVAFTPFIAAGAIAVALLALLLRVRGAAIAGAVLSLVLVGVVAPRALGGPTEAEGGEGPRLRVLTANMHLGRGAPESLAAIVRATRPDVVSVQELTPGLARTLDRAGFAEQLPYRALEARRGGTGIGLYSRLPLAPLGSPPGLRNPMAIASAELPGAARFELVAFHAPPPVRDARVAEWRRDLRAVPEATTDGTLRVVAGDFNATIDHAELRRILDTGYEDAAAEIGQGLKSTWPSNGRLVPPVAIDHVLADRRAGVREVSFHEIPGSDHRAVFAELVLPRG